MKKFETYKTRLCYLSGRRRRCGCCIRDPRTRVSGTMCAKPRRGRWDVRSLKNRWNPTTARAFHRHIKLHNASKNAWRITKIYYVKGVQETRANLIYIYTSIIRTLFVKGWRKLLSSKKDIFNNFFLGHFNLILFAFLLFFFPITTYP